ncbi:hypothetical protein QQG74_28220 [Micromonospora sp. FIMYZ51]|uniref:AbiTii domain-containing protein n=1 Tax=Micromonospora sp. FIMYZ51 TaxID=3051832 RepID=UPI00311D71AA
MTLLTEIIDGASGEASVARLLRQLKVVAARTGTGRLAEWVDHELSGYPDSAPLPDYRGPFRPPILGHFIGPFNTEARNMPIPEISFPEDMRKSALFEVGFTQPVAELEELASKESVNMGWSADAVEYYNWGVAQGKIRRIMHPGMGLVNASRPFPRQIFVGILDAVRNRVLDLALELERVAPEAGQPDAHQDSRDRAAQVMNTYNFYGSSNNVAIESSSFSQVVNVTPGDEPSLVRALEAAGVSEASIQELRTALEEDRREAGGDHPREPGARVRGWLARTTTQVGVGAAGGLITEAVKAFLGS